jgi:hypothetical protein
MSGALAPAHSNRAASVHIPVKAKPLGTVTPLKSRLLLLGSRDRIRDPHEPFHLPPDMEAGYRSSEGSDGNVSEAYVCDVVISEISYAQPGSLKLLRFTERADIFMISASFR